MNEILKFSRENPGVNIEVMYLAEHHSYRVRLSKWGSCIQQLIAPELIEYSQWFVLEWMLGRLDDGELRKELERIRYGRETGAEDRQQAGRARL